MVFLIVVLFFSSGYLSPRAVHITTASQLPSSPSLLVNNASTLFDLSSSDFVVFVRNKLSYFSLNLSFIRTEISAPPGTPMYDFLISNINYSSVKFTGAAGLQVSALSINQSDFLRIAFLNSFNVGTILSLQITGFFENASTHLQVALTFSSLVRLMRNQLNIPQSYELLGLEPQAQQKILVGNVAICSWNYANRGVFQLNATYLVGISADAVIITTADYPSTAKESIIITCTLENTLNIPIVVEIIAPDWFTVSAEKQSAAARLRINLLPKSIIPVKFSAENLEAGHYSGEIYFTAQGNILQTVHVTFSIKTSSAWMFALSALSLLSIAAIVVYVRYSTKNDSEIQNLAAEIHKLRDVELISQPTIVNASPAYAIPAKPKVDFSALSRFMSAREVDILKFIYAHPGTTQQAIADDQGLSKATISRIIMQFESKQFIRKEANGMSNQLFLEYDSLLSKT